MTPAEQKIFYLNFRRHNIMNDVRDARRNDRTNRILFFAFIAGLIVASACYLKWGY